MIRSEISDSEWQIIMDSFARDRALLAEVKNRLEQNSSFENIIDCAKWMRNPGIAEPSPAVSNVGSVDHV